MDGKKMSKSKGNVVSLSAELDQYGVDAVRLTMLFASPPEDDVDWADVSVAGSGKFLARAWRISGEVTSPVGVDFGEGDRGLRRETHRFLADIPQLASGFKFNVVIARLMELTNATRKAIDSGAGPADPAVREAAEAIAVVLDMYAPHAAEDMWERLGHEGSISHVKWPTAARSLLTQDQVTAVVQINGKVRHRLDVPPTIDEASLEQLAISSPKVQAAIDGREIVKIIVRAPKLVNIAVKG